VVLALLAGACSSARGVAVPGFETGPPAQGPHQLVDVTREVGIEFEHGAFRWETAADPVAMMGGGVCWLDFDRDGWLDLYAVNTYAEAEWGRWQGEEGGLPSNGLYRNEDGAAFTDVSEETGTDLRDRGNGCVAADFNRDGWTDLYVTTARFNELLWNNGDGTFTQGAEEAGVDAYGWQAGAAAGDLNGDGWPDLVVTGYVDVNNRIVEATKAFPNTQQPMPDLLYLSQGSNGDDVVTFTEVGTDVGLGSEGDEYGLGVLLSDVDRDGDLDMYVANDTNPNRLYLTEPDLAAAHGFRLIERQDAGADDENSGMGVASGDYDRNGRFDLFVSNFDTQLHAVLRNISDPGQPLFEDALPTLGVTQLGMGLTGWGAAWVDLDHDTDLDLFIVHGNVPVFDMAADRQPLQVLLNRTAEGQRGVFEDGSSALGLDAVPDVIGRGSAFADYDNDGDLDIALIGIGGTLTLLENRSPPGNWLTVVLDGPAQGTTVAVSLGDGTVLEREVHAGSSYLSSEDPRPHFGLGDATDIRGIVVRWPDGSQTAVEGPPVNSAVVVAHGGP